MCKVLKLHPSGFYAWRHKPVFDRKIEDRRLLKMIREYYVASSGTYDSPCICRDLREAGEVCNVQWVAEIMRKNRLRAQIGYKRRHFKCGKPAQLAGKRLNRVYNPDRPNKAWVGDITHARTYERFMYVATVLDIFSRNIVGWTIGKNIDRHLVTDAISMTKLRRQPKNKVLFHNDQVSQYDSHDCISFLEANNMLPSMSRRGN
ncbi:MAG: IS3 family transposase [Gammaproteobacteria bacterium]